MLTLREAAEWCGKSKSTIRKAWLTGKFPNGSRDTSRDVRGIVQFPIGDLIAAGYTPREIAEQVATGFSKKEVGSMLNMLQNIFKFAIGKQILERDPSIGLAAKDPAPGSRKLGPNSKATAPVHMFDLVTSKRIASKMHIHHQMAFWIIRCVGLRISETYGVTLEDIYRDGENMTIRIWRQGGKNFLVKKKNGKKTHSKVKESVKTLSSSRVLPIAKPVALLIDHYIEAFHENEVDPSTPLLLTNGGSAQSSFRDALEKASTSAGFGLSAVGFKATPHTHRKYFATDMVDVTPRARSVYMGHKLQDLEGGAAITETTYTVQRKGVEHLLVVADAMASLIETTIGGLIEPVTAGRLLPTSVCTGNYDRERALEVLEDAGYVRVADVDGDQVIEVAQAAELLAFSETHVRRLIRRGELHSKQIDGAGCTVIRGVTMSSIEARIALSNQLWTRAALCTEFSLTYIEIHTLIKALGVRASKASVSLADCYDADEVEKIRVHLDAKAAARISSASISEVTEELSCTRRTAQHLLELGRLELDVAATESLKMTMVTKKSLQRLKFERVGRKTLSQPAPAGTIPILEAQSRTGLDRVRVLQLRSEGVIIQRTSDWKFHVDKASLDAYTKQKGHAEVL
jgi:integrase